MASCGKASDVRDSPKGARGETSQGARIETGGRTEIQANAQSEEAAKATTSGTAENGPKSVDIGDGKKMWMLPLRHQNLTLLPVTIDPAQVDPTDYLTLDEGMKSKAVKITEVSDSGDVNNLRIKNTSDKPLFLLAGEVIIGGKQDRIIGKTLVVMAGERTTVPVFCVEQGRWNARKADFSSAESIAHLKLRSVANYGGSQSGVWSEVSDKNAARGESNSTDTYRAVATKKGVVSDYKAAIEAAYAKEVRGNAIAGEPLAGFAIAYNGEIVGIESFQSPTLMGKLRSKLLHSYYVDAIDRVYDKERSSRDMAVEAHSKGSAYKGRKQGRKAVGEGRYENKASKTSSWKRGSIRSTEVRVKGKGKGKPRFKGEGEGEADQDPGESADAPLYDSVKLK